MIRAQGTRSNRFGLGATVEVQTAGADAGARDQQCRRATSARNDVRLHVGLGAATIVPRIAIRWPSGTTQTLTDVAADQILTVREPPAPAR